MSREKKSGLFPVYMIILLLLVGAFMAFSGEVFDFMSRHAISDSLVNVSGQASVADDYFKSNIFSDKQYSSLKNHSSAFDFDRVGTRTMPPVLDILDEEGKVIGQKTPVKSYVGNNRPF